MKRFLCVGLVFFLLAGVLCGCNSKDTDENKSGTSFDLTAPEKENIDWYDFPAYEKRGLIKDIKKLSEFSKNCEVYEFTYPSDKYMVKGFIAIPAKCVEEETPFGCVVYNRGGNSNMGFLTGEEMAAMCVASNRVVIGSQYRGADGSEGKDEFGGADLKDVTALIDLCEKEFRFVNIENLCMVGISRGGMMSYLAARDDKRVKGIVAISAVTDLAASYNEREDMRDIMHDCIGGSPEELPEEYAKRSAVNFAKELDVPVFIIHSKDDELVSYSQAKTMNELLKETKHGCTMTTHLDNVHGLHPEDAVSIVQWLDQTLSANPVQN